MFNKKQLYLIGGLALALSLVLVQVQVKAAWTNPNVGPNGTATNPPITNPLQADLNLNNKNLTSGGSATFSSGVFSALDLKNGNLVNVSKINGQTPVFGGGLDNPLKEDLSGDGKFGIKDLMSCNPAKDEVCGAVEGVAGKSQFSNSFSAGVYGYTEVASGVNPSYGVYGLTQNSGGYGVYGLSMDENAPGGYFQNYKAAGKALVANGLTELNGNVTVAGNVGMSNLAAVNGVFGGTLQVDSTSYMEGLVTADNGAQINGGLRVDAHAPKFGQISAIVGHTDGTTYANNAGVEGQGTVGVYGDGHLVGVFGLSGGYGGIFRGSSAEGWNPPPGGGMDNSGIDDLQHGFISKLFGIEKTHADLNIPGPVGVVAAGGWLYNDGFTKGGLGICALSGEKAREVENSYSGDFFEYCQDGGGANNFAGFFSGNVYIKDGSVQFNDTLTASGENLIYGNIGNTSVAGSHLIKLQTNGSDKFKVDRAGNAFLDGDLNMDDLIAGNVTADDFIGDIATFDQVLLGEDGILAFDTVGKNKPSCLAETEGYTYYFQDTKALCICTGSTWKAVINSQVDSACR